VRHGNLPMSLASLVVLALLAEAGAAEPTKPAGPASLVLKPTWVQTMVASREALVREEQAAYRAQEAAIPGFKDFKPFRAELTFAAATQPVKVRVTGLKRFSIGTSGGQEHFFLAEPRLVDADGNATALSVAMAKRGGRLARLRHDGEERIWTPIKIGQQTFARGAVGNDFELTWDVGDKALWFEATIGLVPRNVSPAVRVCVWVEAVSLADRANKQYWDRLYLWDLAARAFPDGLNSRQQRLELAAEIWRDDWTDLPALAMRYAALCPKALGQRAEKMAQACTTVEQLESLRELHYLQYASARLDLAARTLELVERSAPRPQFAPRIEALRRLVEDASAGRMAAVGLYARACELRREIILSHPLLDFPRLLINKRSGSLAEHMCDQYLGRGAGSGAGLVVLDDWKTSPRETELLSGQVSGHVLHPDLSYDGKRVLFALASSTGQRKGQYRGYWIYEYSFETGKVRQVTGTPSDRQERMRDRQTVLVEDFDPCYLPDGGFAFISTRSQQFGRCHGGRYVPSYILYRGELDGSKIRPLSYNESNEWGPAVLHDGAIVYTRWDYVNRHDVLFQSLWGIHPDGTQTTHFYGNNSPAPCLIGETQPIPGVHKVVATAAAHHGQTLGSIIVIDPSRGQDHGHPLTWVTPELPFPESGVPPGITSAAVPLADDRTGGFGSVSPGVQRAGTPWPLNEDLFLCTYWHSNRNYGIYLIDTVGGRELIHADPSVACFDPIPLRPRPMPAVMSSAIAGREKEKTGVFTVQNVYQCSFPLEKDSIKSIRVNEIISQPTSSSPVRSKADNEVVKKILGTVPVNADGSAAFEAPANTPLQLQLLDANGMAVMTMRSLIYVQPGERAGCIGCHENRYGAPPVMPASAMHIAKIAPPAGAKYEPGFSFVRTVQPVLDRYCIGCHGPGTAPAKCDLLGHRPPSVAPARSTAFSAAYESLTVGGLVRIAPRNGESFPSRPKDYFAHAGRLAKMLLEGHPDKQGKKRVELDRDSFQRIVDWMDVNCQFYGDYSFNRIEDQPPLPAGEKALREAIARRFGDEIAQQPFAALVNVANTGESRILMAPLPQKAGGWGQIERGAYSGASDPAYVEMRKLVEASITPTPHKDIAGTCGRDAGCRCGSCWVRLDVARQATTRPSVAAGN